jgi:hypothetical protein
MALSSYTIERGKLVEHLDYYGHGVTTDTDNMNGYVYRDGRKVKTYRGESAWADAERYASDLATDIRYGKA